MSQTTLLECREAAAAQNHANGDWQTVLNAPQMLMPGDQVILKTAALDTRKATTGTITLENDVSATISGYPYVVNYQVDDKDFVQTTNQADYRRYFAADLHQQRTGATEEYKIIESLHIVFKKEGDHDIPKSSFTMNYKTPPPLNNNTIVKPTVAPVASGTALTLETNANVNLSTGNGVMFIKSTKNETATFTFTVSTFKNGTTTQIVSDLKANVPFLLNQCVSPFTITSIVVNAAPTVGTISVGTAGTQTGNGTLRINVPLVRYDGRVKAPMDTFINVYVSASSSTNPSDITFTDYSKKATTDPVAGKAFGTPKYTVTPILSPASASNSHFIPLQLTHSFTIPAGTYNTNALCSFVNNSITLNTAQTSTNKILLGNDMLKSSAYRGDAKTTFFVCESNASGNKNAFTFKNDSTGGSWMGASTIQLGINNDTNCFEWQYLHTPYYDSLSAAGPVGTGVASTLYEQQNDTFLSTSSMMGIALTSLTPTAFWESQLGFDVTYATYSNSITPLSIGSIVDTLLPSFDVDIGTNTTAQFVGTDSVVVKKNKPQAVPTFSTNPHLNNNPKQFLSTTNLDNFLPVKAPIAYTTLAKDTTGYFLLDVQTNFRTETVGSTDTSRTIQAIVGRFYNTGSFTIAGSDSGIVYQHVGAPQMIQSLSIRILHPDGTLADDVGNDSTLYFEIQRQIK